MGMKRGLRTNVISFGVVFTATVIALAFQACGRTPGTWEDLSSNISGQDNLGSSGGGGTNIPIQSGPGGPDYSALDAAIFQPKCSGCHAQFVSYTTLMAAKTSSGASFVVASNSAASAIHIETNAGRMPTGVALPADQIAAIKAWIDAGAKPPGSSGTPVTPTPVPTPDLQATWTSMVAANGVMANNCVGCHSGARPSGDLDLLNYVEARESAGDILEMINGEEDEVMPPTGPMIKAYRDTISSWVNRGAPR